MLRIVPCIQHRKKVGASEITQKSKGIRPFFYFINQYRITPHIRPGPYIRYKAHPGSKKLKILIYIRPGPYKSVIRPMVVLVTRMDGPYNGKGTPYNGNISIVKGTLPVIRPTPGLITGRVADFCR